MSGPGGSSRKRNNEGGEGISAVEKLYKRNQQSYYSAGGFDEDDDAQQEIRERITEAKHRKFGSSLPNVAPPDDCIECAKPLLESFLWDSYNHPVCDVCRDDKGTHKLISRTEAKKLFLLKDEDFDIRKPILRYISRKNPHNPRYGDMKLYLKSQIEVRMLEIYGSWEKFEDAKEQRIAQRDAREEKSFEKKIKKMRMEMRTTAKYKRNIKPSKHEHTYGEETHDAKTDVYSQTCTSCGFKMTFEKM